MHTELVDRAVLQATYIEEGCTCDCGHQGDAPRLGKGEFVTVAVSVFPIGRDIIFIPVPAPITTSDIRRSYTGDGTVF